MATAEDTSHERGGRRACAGDMRAGDGTVNEGL